MLSVLTNQQMTKFKITIIIIIIIIIIIPVG